MDDDNDANDQNEDSNVHDADDVKLLSLKCSMLESYS